MAAKPSWHRQLTLAAGLFALGSFAFWLEYQKKPATEAQEELNKNPFTLKGVSVETVSLLNQGKKTELACLDVASHLCKPGDNSRWELKQPSQFKADDTHANGLLSSLNGLSATDTIDLKDEPAQKRETLLKEYGLDSASRASGQCKTISVKTAQGEVKLFTGNAHPLGNGVFALMAQAGAAPNESLVLLIPPHFSANFDHDLTYWRDKKLLSISANETTAFTLESKKSGKIEGIRKGGAWTLHTNGEEFAGDIENIDSLLAGAQFLMAKAFTSDNKNSAEAKTALKGTQSYLTLSLQKENTPPAPNAPAPQVLKIWIKAQPGKKTLYTQALATVSDLDPLFEIDLSAKDRLDKNIKELRLAKLITSMDRFTARKLRFSGTPIGAEALTLSTSDGSKWINEKSKEEVNSDRIQATLEKLSGNRIKDFVELPKANTMANEQKAGIELTLSNDKNTVQRRYLFWKVASQLFARNLDSKRNEAFILDNSVSDGLPWDSSFFKKAK